MLTAVYIGLLLSVADVPPSSKVLLEKMIASRRAFGTADIRWTQDAKSLPLRYRRNRYDGKNWTYEEVGNQDGVVRPDRLGQIGSCSEYRFFNGDGIRWLSENTTTQVSIWETVVDGRTHNLPINVRPNFDARILGIAPEATYKTLDAILPSIIEGVSDDAFKVKDAGPGVSAVTVKLSHSTLTWWLDTERSYNPIKIEQRTHGGQLVSAALIELAAYDHVWFPKRVTYTSVNNITQQLLISNYEILSAEFDRREHPPVLTPKDIGVVLYDSVAWQRPIGRPVECWDGRGFLSMEEVMRQKASGALLPEMFKATREKRDRIVNGDKGRWPAWMKEKDYGIAKPGDVDEWEKYVRRFCLIRKCDNRQKASAKGILDDCRKSAVPLLSRIKEEQAKEKDTARKEAMLAPISDIFTRNLVPRLDALLTTPQSQPTSRPAVSALIGFQAMN